MASQTANEQLIITYEDPDNHTIHKYATAYSEEQGKYYLMKCLERHGRYSNARIVSGKELHI